MIRESLLVHVPHSSSHVPFLDGYTRPELIAGEVEKLTDWHTERIFDISGVEMVRADFSRVFCDVERFFPDHLEPMAAKGMGFHYTHTDDGRRFRHEDAVKDRVRREYYDPHHARLTSRVRHKLETTGTCLILDGHSFSQTPFLREDDQNPDRPDICLGTQDMHSPPWLVDTVASFWREVGFSVRLDAPYRGSLVPLEFLNLQPRVLSLMIEVNRRLYLNEGGELTGAVDRLRSLMEQVVGRILEVAPPCLGPHSQGDTLRS